MGMQGRSNLTMELTLFLMNSTSHCLQLNAAASQKLIEI